MRKYWLFVIFYVLVHSPSGEFAASYQGMDKKTVATLIEQTYHAKFEFIDKKTYQAFINSKKITFDHR